MDTCSSPAPSPLQIRLDIFQRLVRLFNRVAIRRRFEKKAIDDTCNLDSDKSALADLEDATVEVLEEASDLQGSVEAAECALLEDAAAETEFKIRFDCCFGTSKRAFKLRTTERELKDQLWETFGTMGLEEWRTSIRLIFLHPALAECYPKGKQPVEGQEPAFSALLAEHQIDMLRFIHAHNRTTGKVNQLLCPQPSVKVTHVLITPTKLAAMVADMLEGLSADGHRRLRQHILSGFASSWTRGTR